MACMAIPRMFNKEMRLKDVSCSFLDDLYYKIFHPLKQK